MQNRGTLVGGNLKVLILYHTAGAALEGVPWVPVNPWIFKNHIKKPLKSKIKYDTERW